MGSLPHMRVRRMMGMSPHEKYGKYPSHKIKNNDGNVFKLRLWEVSLTWEWEEWWKCLHMKNMHCNGNSVYICIPSLGIARPQPQFPHSCVFERFIYSQDQSTLHISSSRTGRPIVGIYNSLWDTWMWKLGPRPRYSISGNICFKFSAFCLCSVGSLPNMRMRRMLGMTPREEYGKFPSHEIKNNDGNVSTWGIWEVSLTEGMKNQRMTGTSPCDEYGKSPSQMETFPVG